MGSGIYNYKSVLFIVKLSLLFENEKMINVNKGKQKVKEIYDFINVLIFKIKKKG